MSEESNESDPLLVVPPVRALGERLTPVYGDAPEEGDPDVIVDWEVQPVVEGASASAFYDTVSEQVVRRLPGWYVVDGLPGHVAPPLLELAMIVEARPELSLGQSLQVVEVVDLVAQSLTQSWEVVEPSAEELAALQVREVSKLDITRRLRAISQETEDAFYGLLASSAALGRDWAACQVVRTDDPMFTTHAAALKAALSLTDEQFDAIIA